MSYKGRMLFQWILILVMSGQIFYVGYNMLLGNLGCLLLSQGLNPMFITFLGIIELVFTISILFKKYRFRTAFIQMFILCGIIFSDMAVSSSLTLLIDISNIGFLAIILWFEKDLEYLDQDPVHQHTQS